MDARNLPYGAAEIVALRKIGKRPADMVLVSLIGPLRDELNPVVVAQLDRQYDWKFLIGLQCLVVADSNHPEQAIRAMVDVLKALPVEYLGLWLVDCQQGVHFIVDSVNARLRGLLRYMDTTDRQNFAGIGQRQGYLQCA